MYMWLMEVSVDSNVYCVVENDWLYSVISKVIKVVVFMLL